MGAAYFYHLTEIPIEAALPQLLGKAREAGWVIEIRGTDPARIRRLDEQLWHGPAEGFLPHGVSGGPNDALQPILLTTGDGAANRPVCIMAVDGAEVRVDEVAQMERVCILFDAADDAAVVHARGQWKALTDAGCAAQYWAQEDGRWTKKAEKNT